MTNTKTFENDTVYCCFTRSLSPVLDLLSIFKVNLKQDGRYSFSLIGSMKSGTAGLALEDINSKVFEVLSPDDFEQSLSYFINNDEACFCFDIDDQHFIKLFMDFADTGHLDDMETIVEVFSGMSAQYDFSFETFT